MNSIPIIKVGDVLEMKKTHPCGSKEFKVLRVGSDVKIACVGCSHSLNIERVKLEKMIKKIISCENGEEND